MLDAIQKLLHEGAECCRFSRLITDHAPRHTNEPAEETVDITGFEDLEERLNKSQIVAVKAAIVAPLALIWGPPGTYQSKLSQFIDNNGRYRQDYRCRANSEKNHCEPSRRLEDPDERIYTQRFVFKLLLHF